MVLFLVLQYMHGIKTKNGANISKVKWVVNLLLTLGVRECEPKCADPLSDEKNVNNFFITR